mmetsp:Transcript_29547/g.96294  ORF Transcript_29547/g.96294 Transcript_29547/m.96294 type:complete len:428 (+) Transcript_29547:149-1432(+)
MCAQSCRGGLARSSLLPHRSTPINAPLAGPKAKAGRPSPQPHLVLAHLLGERLLVLVDGTLQPPHAAVLAQPDLVRHLVDEPKIVRHEHHASAKSLDGGGEAVDCVHVEVVGRLVEQQHRVVLHREHRKDDPRALSVGEHAHRALLLLRREAKRGKVAAPPLLGVLDHGGREDLPQEGQRRHVEVEHVGRVLMVEAEGAMLVLLDGPLRRAQLTRHELEQRRLAATVWTDQRDAAVAVDAEVERLVQRLAARVREGDVVKGEDGRRQSRALGEGESEGGLAQLRLLDRARLELLEHLLLRLCGGGDAVRLVDTHKVGELVDVGLLFLVHLELQPLLLLHRLHELGVVSSVQPQQPAAQPERVRADGVQEVLAVRDEEEALRVRGEVLLEPDARLQVEVVGRLVQQQQLGLVHDRDCDRHAHLPAARQ